MIIFAVIYLILAICCYCAMKRYIPFSIAVLAKTVNILWNHPSIFLIVLAQLFLGSLITGGFSYIVFVIVSKAYHWAWYIYIFFSYVWISTCVYYVLYFTIVGTAGSIYFLEGTDLMPESPVKDAFKRASFKSFGSSAFASFIVAVLKTLRMLADSNSDQRNGTIQILCCLFKCLIMCIEMIFGYLVRFGLIYCALYGIPFIHGCKRFVELEFKKFIGVLMSSCVIDKASSANAFGFSLISAIIGLLLSFIFYGNDLFFLILTPILAFLVTYAFIGILSAPVDSISDTLFICYGECPQRLHDFAEDLDVQFQAVYGDQLTEQINSNNSRNRHVNSY